MRVGRGLTVAGGCAVVAAPFVAHAAISTGRFIGIAILLGAGQAAGLCLVSVRRLDGWQRAVGVATAVALLAMLALRAVFPGSLGLAGLLAASGGSHAIIYLSLLLLFAQSLRPGRTPLVTGLALRMHGTLAPPKRAYTRTVTKAWCVFFAGQVLFSPILLAFTPYRLWSLFINVLDGPLVVLMFAAEYGIRRWTFRHETHHSPLATALALRRFGLGS